MVRSPVLEYIFDKFKMDISKGKIRFL